MSKKSKNFWEYLGFLTFRTLLAPLPSFLQKFILVRLVLLIKIRKKLVIKQLKMVFPKKSDQQISALCREIYRNLALFAHEFFFCNQKKLLKNFEIEGLESLQHSLSQHKGVIYPNLHIGNWEIGMKYMVEKMNLPINALAKRIRNPHLDDYIEKIRRKNGVTTIFLENAFRGTLAALKNDEGIGIMIDQNARKVGLKQDWLGHPASVFQGPAKFAIKSGAMIQPIICIRTKNGFKVIAEEPIDGSLYTKNQIPELTKKICNSLEKQILKYPEQWFWMHKRW